MPENRSDVAKTSEQQIDSKTNPEKADTPIKPLSGRPPARPPYEQYLRVSKVFK
jgi:hypothetical protein